jgi:hypothetical protein
VYAKAFFFNRGGRREENCGEREKVKHGVKDGREKWEVVWVV